MDRQRLDRSAKAVPRLKCLLRNLIIRLSKYKIGRLNRDTGPAARNELCVIYKYKIGFLADSLRARGRYRRIESAYSHSRVPHFRFGQK